ncbi:HTH domain-containing protein [Natrialba sp. INN-245]|uniref:HTH domain-containing protein n=1 Tax=Natrialba sp. INN-245 TaxID=2690967 RepID=UPI00130FE2C5|nr:HTH domain-containing protein [Natrialba sp. INN-245]MWV39933.1 HTH domain-containing protein [Natrialba sp. INN-245]
MGSDRERNDHGQYADRILPEAALEPFEKREDHGRPLTASDVMEALDCSRRTAHNKLNDLVERGELETRKVGARGRVWWIPIEATPDAVRAGFETDHEPDGTERDETTPSVEEAIRTADLPGSGATLEARRDALRAAYEYIVDNPSATKSDFLEHVYPDYPADFETEEGWWNAIQPALKELPAVDPPEERGHIWNFLGDDRFTPTLG